MKTMRKVLCFVVAIAMVTALIPNHVEAATKVKLNKKKVTLTITNSKKNPTTTLKVKGVSSKVAKKAKWSTSNKKVATVKKGKVTAKKAGKATITCKVKGKKYTCKVTVKDKRTKNTGVLNVTVTGASILCKGTPQQTDETNKPILNDTNQIAVTYNGKDVTNEVKYESSDPKVGYVDKPGILESGGYGTKFRLTVSYQGVNKTIMLRKQKITDYYNECYCGAIFYDDYGGVKCTEHRHIETLAEHPGHDGFYIVPYVRYIDFEIVE